MPDTTTPLLVVGRGRRRTIPAPDGYDADADLRRAQRAFEKAEQVWLAAAAERRAAAIRAREIAHYKWPKVAAAYKVNQHRAREIAYPRKDKP
jgi:hypothetical protein